MKIVTLRLKERSYPILIGVELKDIGKYFRKYPLGPKIMIVTNPKVGHLYTGLVEKSLKMAGFKVFKTLIPDGEKYKTQTFANKIYTQCIKNQFDRKATILALGGGVIGDLAGFAAATFMRGLNFIQVPTTLLAQVDSSIGGKVAINLPTGKNMVGAFYQPKLVYIDLNVLKTLPKKELTNGLAEVIKYGVIYDRSLFKYLEHNISNIKQLNKNVLKKIVTRSCQIKALVVAKDEKEKNLRAILNFGHTIGHALEGLTGYKKYTHGEAIAVGMVGACKIAKSLELVDSSIEKRVKALILKVGLPVAIKMRKINWQEILNFLKRDKKVLNENIRFVLPIAIGKVKISEKVPLEIVEKIINSLLRGEK